MDVSGDGYVRVFDRRNCKVLYRVFFIGSITPVFCFINPRRSSSSLFPYTTLFRSDFNELCAYPRRADKASENSWAKGFPSFP